MIRMMHSTISKKNSCYPLLCSFIFSVVLITAFVGLLNFTRSDYKLTPSLIKLFETAIGGQVRTQYLPVSVHHEEENLVYLCEAVDTWPSFRRYFARITIQGEKVIRKEELLDYDGEHIFTSDNWWKEEPSYLGDMHYVPLDGRRELVLDIGYSYDWKTLAVTLLEEGGERIFYYSNVPWAVVSEFRESNDIDGYYNSMIRNIYPELSPDF